MLRKVLVANRGEIAARIIRTVHDMGLEAVAIYAPADIDTPAVTLADESYSLGDGPLTQTYLNLDKILDIASRSGADAIHPGYGFLSENADAATAVSEAGLTWIGPSAHTITQLGDKIRARRTALDSGVQPVPGTNDPVTSMTTVRDFIAEHNLPIVLKRADGGGGRGIHILRTPQDVEDFAKRHDTPGGDLGAYFVEKFIENGRHVETQVMADAHGNIEVVSTRDCSVQRRNQKLIEEAPAPFLSQNTVQTLVKWSTALFRHTDYVGLGTCEFLVAEPAGDEGDGGRPEEANVYFLEVNPRLQVEHTVSEEVTGLDLVMEQIRIAAGYELTAVPEVRGHSIELRITSEDPGDDLTPTSGRIHALNWPLGHGIRIETGVREGDEVTSDFDSMIAKLIVSGPTRAITIARCRRALAEFHIAGIATPASVLGQILAHPDFTGPDAIGPGSYSTDSYGADGFGQVDSQPNGERSSAGGANFAVGTTWLEKEFLPNAELPAAFEEESLPPTASGSGQTGLPAAPPGGSTTPALHAGSARRTLTIELDGRRHTLTLPADALAPAVPAAGSARPVQPRRGSRTRSDATATRGTTHRQQDDGTVTSPMQAIVVRIPVEAGQEVAEGDVLIVLEAMKMEKYIHAPAAGTVENVLVALNQNVNAGAALVTLAPARGADERAAVPRTQGASAAEPRDEDAPNPITSNAERS